MPGPSPDWGRVAKTLRHLHRAGEALRCAREARDALTVTLAYTGARQPAYPYLLRLRDGFELRCESWLELVTSWVVLFRGEYPDPRGCRVIVDAGANIGAFTLLAARRSPAARIVALEPSPETFARLEELVARNRLGARVRPLQLALAAEPGRRWFRGAEAPSHLRALVGKGEGDPVEAVDLAGLFAREGLERVDLLKLDVEGEEHGLFARASDELLARVDAIALEYHPAGRGAKRRLVERLARAGLHLVHDRSEAPEHGVAWFQRLARRA
ncbi:MAG: FkbM family methyltransferase [Planctomycetota bacterium]